ncbi:MAG: hypothetical protein HY922_10105 [Elusimicrobia bacterium]|nr:hypothetical protein [Elusimicrobiota bacterium]
MSPKRKNTLLTEFVVEVYSHKVAWDNLDRFLLELLHQRPEGGFLRAVRASHGFRRKLAQTKA